MIPIEPTSTNSAVFLASQASQASEANARQGQNKSADADPLREAFDSFVGETFYAQLLKTMRQSVGKPAYLHGGRAEEIFQSQLDQTLAENMAKADAHHFTDAMFRLFSMPRR